MIYISDRSARNFMRYSIRGLWQQATDVAQLRFYQVDPAIITDPVKMAAIKAHSYLDTTNMGASLPTLTTCTFIPAAETLSSRSPSCRCTTPQASAMMGA